MRQQCAATAWAMGVSLGQIVTLLAIVLPACRVPSRATVGRWVEQAGRQAGGILTVLDRVCQGCVVTLCLDEIFVHRDPVLVAVEPHSMAWVAGQRGPDRTGDSWCRVLQQWPGVVRVVSDAGPGLARGVTLLNAARMGAALAPAQVPGPPVQVGLEVLHTEREMQRVVGRQWARAEKLVDTAAQADQQVAHATQQGLEARGAAGRARAAWGKAERAFDEAVQVDTAVERLRAALACVRPDGQRKDRAWAQAQSADALGALGGEAWSTVRRLLDEARTLHHVDWMQAQLVQARPGPAVTRGRGPSVVLAGIPGTCAGHALRARGADGRHGAAPVSTSGPGLARGVRTSWAHPCPHGAREERGRVQPLYAWQTAWGESVPTTRTPPPDGRLVGALAGGSRSIGAKTVNSRSYAVRQSRSFLPSSHP